MIFTVTIVYIQIVLSPAICDFSGIMPCKNAYFKSLLLKKKINFVGRTGYTICEAQGKWKCGALFKKLGKSTITGTKM